MIYLQLSALCFLVFCRSLPGPVRLHDDQASIVALKTFYADLSPAWWRYVAYGSGRPVYDLLNALNWHWKRSFYPPAWHMVNYALHAATCCLILRTLFRFQVQNSEWLAVAFAVHPFQTHSVNYISGRSGILAALFLLVGINVYLLPFPWACLAVIPFWLAFQTREDSIVFLLWLPALEWIR